MFGIIHSKMSVTTFCAMHYTIIIIFVFMSNYLILRDLFVSYEDPPVIGIGWVLGRLYSEIWI